MLARSSEVSSYPRATGLPELREAIAGWIGAASASRSIPRRRSCRRSARRRRSSRSRRSRSARSGWSRFPSRRIRSTSAARCSRAARSTTLPLARRTAGCPTRRVRRLGRDRALLGLLPEQPDRRRRAALVLRGARRARPRARLPGLLGRGVLGAVVRRAAGLGAAGRRPHERRRLQHAVEALVDDRLPLGVRLRAGRDRRRAASFRPTVGTAPQEFVQRASVAAWSDDATSRTCARSIGASARRCCRRSRRGLRLGGLEATFYLWLDVGARPSRSPTAARARHRRRAGSFFGRPARATSASRSCRRRPNASARRRSSGRSCDTPKR